MSRRSALLALLAWLAVVLVVSLVTWRVIDDAGEGVLGTELPVASDGSVSPPTDTTPSSRPTRRPHASPPTSRPTASSSSTPVDSPTAPVVSTQIRSSQTEAGSVTASCTGSTLRLQGASPRDGYSVDTNRSDGGRELRVRFEPGSDDADRVEVLATCQGGVPVFRVERD